MSKPDFDSELGDIYMRMRHAQQRADVSPQHWRPAMNQCEAETARAVRHRIERGFVALNDQVSSDAQLCTLCHQFLSQDQNVLIVREIWPLDYTDRIIYYRHAHCP